MQRGETEEGKDVRQDIQGTRMGQSSTEMSKRDKSGSQEQRDKG